MRYASAFPVLSQWQDRTPEGKAWPELRLAARRALERKFVRLVAHCSYSGVIVDEYQDCSIGQHALITEVAQVLPCRVLGDPLQAIFWKINDGDNVSWSTVESFFGRIAYLSTPHRWKRKGCNEALGEWLMSVRKSLEAGTPIDLREGPISWERQTQNQNQLAACKSALAAPHRIVGIRQWRPQCHKLSRNLKNTFSTMEDVECKDLLAWAHKFEASQGAERVQIVIEFAGKWLARLPDTLNRMASGLTSNRYPKAKNPDRLRVALAMRDVAENADLRVVDGLLGAIEDLKEKPTFASKEIWSEMRRTLRNSNPLDGESLRDAAWRTRDQSRHIGRIVPYRCLSTTLLVKGLEFDHAIILNAKDLPDAENLYVAMTRGSKALTILSESPVLRRPLPQFLRS